MKRLALILCVALGPATALSQERNEALGLQEAIDLAVRNDPWLSGSQYRESALSDQAISAGTLPDPRVSLMAANFPTDTFSIGQEPMTQVAVGISQMFPRGDTLNLSRQEKQQLSAQEPLLRADRQAKVTSMAAQLWLEVHKAQESIALIHADRDLFDQLVDVARAGYTSAAGRSRQQDLIRAQLELTRLEDRLTVLLQHLQSSQQRLSEWIGSSASRPVTHALPSTQPVAHLDALAKTALTNAVLYERIRRHPALLAFDRRIDAMATGVDLARQKFKPEWGVTAQYGYRADDRLGRDRADLFSVGVSFDLPFFTRNRQDKDLSAALALTDAIKTDKDLLARQLIAELRTLLVQIERVDERGALYSGRLLPQMAELSEASLMAYTNDDGEFAEAVRARIAELNAKIDALAIAVERRQLIFRLNYLLNRASSESATVSE